MTCKGLHMAAHLSCLCSAECAWRPGKGHEEEDS